MLSFVKKYELTPTDGRKSFYGKAKVGIRFPEGDEVLLSYDTPIIRREKDGTLIRLYPGYSATTGRHIKAFCGLNKKEFEKLPYESSPEIQAALYAGTIKGID